MSASIAMPVGGRLFTRPFQALLVLGALGAVLTLWRFASGLGATTAMNDGYPWGIWIAFDVVTGTAMGAGGYALALLVYALNRGQYHPLVRPAMVTTALGYSIAGFSVMLDVGRWWNIWRIPISVGSWNLNSSLLEVALCIMGYMAVAWIEVGDSILQGLGDRQDRPSLAVNSRKIRSGLRKVLPFIIALGILLPTMHQSSLGALFVLTSRLHPMWHSSMLPLLFLVSCLSMGFGGVILESTISNRAFKREAEWTMLGRLSKIIAWVLIGWVVLRLGDIAVRGAFDFSSPLLTTMFLLEMALFLVPAGLYLGGQAKDPGVLFFSAVMLLAGGALYRFDTYLIAFQPGRNWSYFPSVTEIMVSVGLVAIEIAIYVFIVKRFPILAGRSNESPS